jgi:hypothetical protein
MLDERSLTKGEDKKKEKYVKGMKKSFSDFRARYGDDAKSVMYATATKMAKEENIDEVLGGKPGDGYLGHPNLDIKNPFAKKQTKAPVLPGANAPEGPNVNTIGATYGDRNMRLQKLRQQMRNSYEPKGEPIEEIAPVVAGAAAVGKMAAKAAAKKGLQKVGKVVTADAAKAMVGGKVKKGPVAAGSKVVGKSAKPQSSSMVKSSGMQSRTAPSIPSKAKGQSADPKKAQKPAEPKTPTSTSEPSKPQEPTKAKEPGKQKEKKKGGVEDGVKKGYQSVKSKVTGFTAMFDPKESYDQDSELLTFSDFREIVSICVTDEEEVEEAVGTAIGIGAALGLAAGGAALIPTVKRKAEELRNQSDKRMGKPATYKEETTNEGAAWTKKAGKNSEGGLNEKGRKSYEKENPGSDLKAPSKKVGNPRRASFCARMKGMKKKLTSKKTANDPDSRINKSLRAWNC